MWFGLRPALRASKFVPDEFVGIHAEMTTFPACLNLCISVRSGAWEPAKLDKGQTLKMKILSIDRTDLILALTTNFEMTESAYYLDRETGALILFNEEFKDDPDYGIPEDIQDNPRYLHITPFQSYETYSIMEDFIDTLEPGKIADRMTRAINGKKPFRHFKDTLSDYPGLSEQWFQFEETALTRMTDAWCKDYGIKVEWISNV